MEKNDIAAVLDEIATFMELTGENPFKIRAYSAGARILENMTEDLGELIDGGKLPRFLVSARRSSIRSRRSAATASCLSTRSSRPRSPPAFSR